MCRFVVVIIGCFAVATSSLPASILDVKYTILRDDGKLIVDAELSPDGTILAVGSGAGDVTGFDLASGKKRFSFRSSPFLTRLAFSKDGRILACGFHPGLSEDGTGGGVQCFDTRTGKLIASVEGISEGVFSLAFDSSGKTIAVVGRTAPGFFNPVRPESQIHLWTIGEKSTKLLKKGHFLGIVQASDGSWVAVPDAPQENLFSFDAHGRQQWSAKCGAAVAFAQTGDKRILALVGTNKQISLWNVTKKKKLRTLEAAEDASAIAFGLDGRVLAVSGAHDKIRLVDTDSNEERLTLQRAGAIGTGRPSIMFVPKREAVVVVSSEGRISIWDLKGQNHRR